MQNQGYIVFPTALGHCGLAWGAKGIKRLQLPGANAAETEKLLMRRVPSLSAAAPDDELRRIIESIVRYFAGEATDFSRTPVDLDGAEPFHLDVYQAVRLIGWGNTTTYGAVAKTLGSGPEKARDVGQAMAKNPVPLIIPCHRVLAAGGRLGGFSAPGGSTTKLRMLALENAGRASDDEAQGSLF
jgi:methylated-DNA-[protein]-cysteine S-methyltransferase